MQIDIGRLAIVLNRGLQQILLQLADLAVQIETTLLAHLGVKIDVVVLHIQGVIAPHNRFDLFKGVIVQCKFLSLLGLISGLFHKAHLYL